VSELSVRKSCMPPIRRNGSMTRPIRTIPAPPTNWRSERQSNSPRGAASSPTITVAPVVVSPETVSNTASVTDRWTLPSWKGREPNQATAAQVSEVNRKPVRRSIGGRGPRVASRTAMPTNTVVSAAPAKPSQSGWPSARSTAIGRSIAPASSTSSQPTACTTIRNGARPGGGSGALRSTEGGRLGPLRRSGGPPRLVRAGVFGGSAMAVC